MKIDIGLAVFVSGIMISLGLSSIGSAIRSFRVESSKYEFQRIRETIEKISKEWLFYFQHRMPPR